MTTFEEELTALEAIYMILQPLGMDAVSRIWSHVSLRLTAEAAEAERLAAEERERREAEVRKRLVEAEKSEKRK